MDSPHHVLTSVNSGPAPGTAGAEAYIVHDGHAKAQIVVGADPTRVVMLKRRSYTEMSMIGSRGSLTLRMPPACDISGTSAADGGCSGSATSSV